MDTPNVLSGMSAEDYRKLDEAKQPFIAPDELINILAKPGILKGPVAQRARTLYHDMSSNFGPFRDLSKFGTCCFLGLYDALGQEYAINKPDLQGTETSYRWGYIMLAAAGSRHIRHSTQNNAPAPSPHAAVIRFLLARGTPVDLPDIAGLTALHHVAMNNRVGEVLRLLLESGGADPNRRDRYGNTPLSSAVIERQPEAVQMCLEFGADPNIKDGDGCSSFDAAKYSTPAISALLHKYQRQRDGIQVPMEEKDKCAACGKFGSKQQCSRCRVVRYCNSECQALDWKKGHKSVCLSFNDKTATLVLKPTYSGPGSDFVRKNTADLANEIYGPSGHDGEGRRAHDAKLGVPHPTSSFPKPKANTHPSSSVSTFDPSMLGKSIIIKAQVPPVAALSAQGILVYNKTRKFTCVLHSKGQEQFYWKLDAIIREKGALGGLKGYFVAELESKERLRIKAFDILADQPW